MSLLFAVAAFLLCSSPALVSAGYPWPDNVTQFSGYMDLDESHGVAYFYWFFESRNNASSDPLVLWLTGGPGCSSLLALFGENGPFLLNTTDTPAFNPYSWNSFANLLYVDQPAGTGFSYITDKAKYDTNEEEIAKALWDFIMMFYKKYPKYSNLDFYIIGESYAGHYVPAIGRLISAEVNSIYAANLKGIAIGNGWVDPLIQYKAYGQYAYANGLVGKDVLDVADGMYDVCKELIKSGVWPIAVEECQLLGEFVLTAAEVKRRETINPYDIRLKCQVPPLCYDMSAINKFLARHDIKEELGVANHSWVSCRRIVELHLLGDWIKEFQDAVSVILKAGRRVLVYSGKEDYICNYLGGLAWTTTISWDHTNDFEKAPFENWMVDSALAGEVKAYGPLTFLEVEKAGHMVPRDQPKNALDMLGRFLGNKPFS